ncbi:c-type cytochrome [Chloroflexota bacterium]
MNRQLVLITLLVLASIFLGACSTPENSSPADSESLQPAQGGESRMGMGPGSGMMNRHHAQVPEAFAGLTNPIPSSEKSLARGEDIYVTNCATCHGDYGNGDGPGGENLDPAPAAIAHTSQMMGDAYLFWRITEGGIPFETGMIPYRDILDEQGRWDVINYVRALGSGQVQPGQHMGGLPFDPSQEQAQRVEMLMHGVDEGIITQDEADIFDRVHSAMDKYLAAEGTSGMDTGQRSDALTQILAVMVAGDLVNQDQADTFMDVHDRLIEAGLMQ